MITIYLLEFLFFSVVGGIIDLIYNQITEGEWSNTGYFQAPFCPIYGVGGVVLVLLYEIFPHFSLFAITLLGTMAMVLVEYLGGIFTEKILQVRVWNYSSSRFNYQGHIDILHSGYWLLLVILFYIFILPPILTLKSMIRLPELLEIPFLLVLVIGLLGATLRKIPSRYLIIKDKYVRISFQQYNRLLSMIKLLSQAKSLEIRRKIILTINQQLRHTGAYLKKIKH